MLEIKDLSAVADFLKNNENPEYQTTKEIVDDVYGVVSGGLKVADALTGGFFSPVIDRLNPSKLINELPDRFNYANGLREEISLYNYNKFHTANFMIIWVSIAYTLQKECKGEIKKEDFNEYQKLLNLPNLFESEQYIKTVLPLLTSKDISQEVIEAYRANTNSIKVQFPEYKTFCETAHQFCISDILIQIIEKLSPPIPQTPKNLTPMSPLPAVKNFVGREDALKEIEEQLSKNSSLLLINGIGGIGKSTLAARYLSLHKEEFGHYGYIAVFDDIKANMVAALKHSLHLQAQTIDENFEDAIIKLHSLQGKKLLVLDDIKGVEKQREVIKIVQGLSGWELLFTSRESIDNITPYHLERLSLQEARELFMLYSKVSDIEKIDALLKYLDRHTLFVEFSAKSLKKDRKLTLDGLLKMFQKGELPRVRIDRKESFNDYLQKRFSLDGLDGSQKLLLKKLSLLPSIEIPYETIEHFLDMEDLGWILNELRDKGWLSSDSDKSYKMHQIIKEFTLNNHTPKYEEIKDLVDSANTLLKKSADAQTAVDNRANIVYFDSIADALLQKGIENENIALFFLNVANIYYYLGEFQKALPLYEKALEISKEILGERHPNTATSYNNLALLYDSMGEYEKALPLYKKALKIKEETLGERHPDTATSYNNLALLYDSMGEYEKALPLYKKALEIREERLGERHPDTATSYNSLAVYYFGLQNYQEAYEYMKKAIAVWQKVLPASHPHLINSQEGLEVILKYLR